MENSVFESIESFGLNVDLWGDDSELMQAVRKRNYPAIRARLAKAKLPFFADEGYRLCLAAIQSGCTCRTVESLLNACPPIEEFSTATAFFGERYYEKLEEAAARFDRGDVLRLLMERDTSGLPPAQTVAYTAIRYGSVACTHLLSQRPEIDWAATDELKQVWGMLGKEKRVDLCLRRVAPRLMGTEFDPEGEIPLPDFLGVDIAAQNENWPLVRRICQEKSVNRKEGLAAIRHIMGDVEKLDRGELAQLLDCLFEVCPELLRCHYPRYALAVALVTEGEENRPMLRRHLESMPGKRIPLFADGIMEPCIHWNGTDGLFTHWDEALGEEYYPALQRVEGLASSFFHLAHTQAEWDRNLEDLFRRCRVMGVPKRGRVSALAREVLKHASPALIPKLMERGGLLEEEDTTAMLEWCLDRGLWGNRAAILAHGKKEVDYEL